ncbi:MAG: SRPBCC family protein [Actinomycetota bacterium]
MKTPTLSRSFDRQFMISGSTASTSTPDRVAALLHDPRSWPVWQREILDAEGPSPLVSGDVVQGRAHMLGFGVQGQATVIDGTDRRLEKDVIVGVRMRIRVEVDDSVMPMQVTYGLEADLPDGVLGRVLSFFLKRRFKRMQSLVLDALSNA